MCEADCRKGLSFQDVDTSKATGSSIRPQRRRTDLAQSVSSFVGESIASRRVCADFTALTVPTHEMCECNRPGCNCGPSRTIKVRKLALDRSLTNRHSATPRHANPARRPTQRLLLTCRHRIDLRSRPVEQVSQFVSIPRAKFRADVLCVKCGNECATPNTFFRTKRFRQTRYLPLDLRCHDKN